MMALMVLLAAVFGLHGRTVWYETALTVRSVGLQQAKPTDVKGPYLSLDDCAAQQQADQDAEAKTRSGIVTPSNPVIIYWCSSRIEPL
jgi:hypothetical protein